MKDAKGNELRIGDECVLHIDTARTGLCFCRITEIKENNLTISDGRNHQPMPSQVRVLLDITLTAPAGVPFIPLLCKIVRAGSDEILDRLTQESHPDPIKFPKKN